MDNDNVYVGGTGFSNSSFSIPGATFTATVRNSLVTIINKETKEISKIRLGKEIIRDIDTDADNLYVATKTAMRKENHHIFVYDKSTNQLINEMVFEGENIVALAATNGPTLFALSALENNSSILYTINKGTFEILDQVGLEMEKLPRVLIQNSETGLLYTIEINTENNTSCIHVLNETGIIDTIEFDGVIHDIAFDDINNKIYAIKTNISPLDIEAFIIKIEISTNQIEDQINIGKFVGSAIAVWDTNVFALANNIITVVDSTGEILQTITLPLNAFPFDITVADNIAYVADTNNNSVFIVEME